MLVHKNKGDMARGPSAAPGASALQQSLQMQGKPNARHEFLRLLQRNDFSQLMLETNRLHDHVGNIDGEMQTLVYENYSKFMDAADLTKSIKESLSSEQITDDLEVLKGSLQSINETHTAIDNTLKLKLKQIKKLDILQKDLDKLKYLSELPDLLRTSIETFQERKKGMVVPDDKSNLGMPQSEKLSSKYSSSEAFQRMNKSSSSENNLDIDEIFGKTLLLYQDYSEILIAYKKTKFMQELYNDIKGYVQKVKVILVNELDAIKDQDVIMRDKVMEEAANAEPGDNVYTPKIICPLQQKRLHDIVKYLVLIIMTQYQQQQHPSQGTSASSTMSQSTRSQKEEAPTDILALRNQVLNQYRQTYRNIKLKQLRALLANIDSYNWLQSLETSEQILNMNLKQLIEVDAYELKTAETALWYTKVIKKEIYDQFMKETIQEYQTLFQHIYVDKASDDDERDLHSLEKLMIQKKGLQFQLSEWQQYQTFFLDLIQPVNKLALKFLANDYAHFRLEVEPSLILLWQSIGSFEADDPNRNTLTAFWSYKRIFVNDIFRKVLCFHYNMTEQKIKQGFEELDLAALAAQSEKAREDPFENVVLTVLNNNLNAMQPQRQGLSEEDDIDIFELRFITKTIQNLQQKLLINSLDNLLRHMAGKLTIVKMMTKDKNQKKSTDVDQRVQQLPAGTFIYISRALQQIDLQVVFQKVKHNFVTTDDAEEINEIAFESEKWQKCIYEKIPQMKEKYNAFSIQLRKLYIDAYSEQINDILYQYFLNIRDKENEKMAQASEQAQIDGEDDTYNDEPANITLEFQKIADLFFKQILKELTLSEFTPIMQKCAQNSEMVTQILEKAPKPELLTNTKQFSQIEMEMDMFLAKKSQIFNTCIFQMEFNKKQPKQDRKQQALQNSEYVLAFNIIKSILHLSLKSMYEILRQQEIRTLQYQNQIVADLYYFYISAIYLTFVLFSTARIITPSQDDGQDEQGISEHRKLAGGSLADFQFDDDMQYKEDLHNLSGIVNEVMTTVQMRSTVASRGRGASSGSPARLLGLDESLLLIICDVNIQKLFQ